MKHVCDFTEYASRPVSCGVVNIVLLFSDRVAAVAPAAGAAEAQGVAPDLIPGEGGSNFCII